MVEGGNSISLEMEQLLTTHTETGGCHAIFFLAHLVPCSPAPARSCSLLLGRPSSSRSVDLLQSP